MTQPSISTLDPVVEGYVFWHDPKDDLLPYRWAAQRASGPGVHFGVAATSAEAVVAAERHAMTHNPKNS